MCSTSRQGGVDAKEREDIREGDEATCGKQNIRRHVTDYFEAPTYRPNQREALEEIADYFEQGFKYVVFEGGTGTGKSHIGNALAKFYGRAHVLTIQKGLQAQYHSDFPHMGIMQGRGAYPCKEAASCAVGRCKVDKTITHGDCPYREAMETAQNTDVVVHNFDSFYWQSLYSGFGYRNLLVVDEAHNIEEKFLGFMEFTISNREYPERIIPEYEELEEYADFLEMEAEFLQDEIERLSDSGKSDPGTVVQVDKLNSLVGKIRRYLDCSSNVEYVLEYKEHTTHQTLLIRPVFVRSFVETFLKTKAERILMMSASIVDKDMFCADIGLDPKEVAFVSYPSHFPPENRPIRLTYSGSMSRKKIDKTLPILLDDLVELLNKYPAVKGIIHTHTDRIANYIKENLMDSRLTHRSNYYTVEQALEVHEKKEASILVASGLREGVDLYGNLSRLQIICKVPYPSLGDERVSRRKELTPEWYPYMTAKMLIQMAGRSVRSATDKALTFILDSDFNIFYHTGGKNFLPKYFIDSIQRRKKDE